MRRPTFKYERQLIKQGYFVIGVDEAGCGCLAGPVIAAAVNLPLNSRIAKVTDSKLLKPSVRERIFEQFIKLGLKFTVGMASPEEIDKLNIRQATLLAMKRAVCAFSCATFALVDAWKIPGIRLAQRSIIHGDRLVKSIAAASIIAKVVRDRLMKEYDKDFPEYFLAKHKGYGTFLHRNILKKRGPCPIHRKSFLKNLGIGA